MLIQVSALPHIIVMLVSLAVLALTVWALIVTLRSTYASGYEKVVLTLMLVFLPIVGLAAWALSWFTKRRSAPAS